MPEEVLKNCGNRTWRVSISLLRGSDMNAGAHTDGGLNAVPLLNAVFCADCETISNSRHDACTVCGSRSLINLFRMLGGTVRSQKPQSAESGERPDVFIWRSHSLVSQPGTVRPGAGIRRERLRQTSSYGGVTPLYL